MQKAKSIVVIPARYESSRFPGKPLAPIQGVTMIQRVWQIAQRCQQPDEIYIATDSELIASHAQSFGAKVLMTPIECLTGTDRVAAACAQFANDDDIVISLQGDAVLTPPWVIDEVIDALQKNPSMPIATPAVKLTHTALKTFLNHKKISPSSGTTVTFDKNFKALYFSKQPIPFHYDLTAPTAQMYRHIGLYGYRYQTLKILQSLPQSPLEKAEKLEQLRALEQGIPIQIVCVDYKGRSHGSVDTPEDIKVVEHIIQQEGELIS